MTCYFSILSQIFRYTPSVNFPNKLTGRVRTLPHFGHFCGMEYTVAIYSISGAGNFAPHFVHLNVVTPLSMVFTPYIVYRDYNAGACAPLFVPLGWFTHCPPVITMMLGNFLPQYLQVYSCFSLPS